VVCEGTWKGKKTLGMRLTFDKRYITLAPVATVIGLAFKLYDPDHLLGEQDDLGITCALVPRDTQGVEIGKRHYPLAAPFMNGPIRGKDVFVPLDTIIGGQQNAGRGWRMLMEVLSVGRGISLPSGSSGGASQAAFATGAYARVRKQFNVSIGEFEGIQEAMARIGARAYACDSVRQISALAVDLGEKPSVSSGIAKMHVTDLSRLVAIDAMDVHSGKAVIDGPLNYLQPIYRTIPVGITVEGANIVTRNLIIFGQGAIRAHPHMLDEIEALQEPDEEKSLDAFDKHFWAHVSHAIKTTFRATWSAWTGQGSAPADAGKVAPIYRRLSRWSAAYAVVADMAFLTLGGALKRKEMISARMGDALSEMFLISAVLKRWEDDGRNEDDLPLVHHAAETSFARIGEALDETIANMPAKWVGWLLRPLIRPGHYARGPSDEVTEAVAKIVYEPCEARTRLTSGLYRAAEGSGLGLLNHAYALVLEAEPLEKRLRDAKKTPREGLEAGILSDAEFQQLEEVAVAVQKVIAVDDYTPDELAELLPGMQRPTTWKEAAE